MVRRSRRVTSSALLAVAAGRPPGQVGPELLHALRRHRLAPLACVLLDRCADPAAELVREDLVTAVSTHLRALATVADLGQALDGIRWAVLKGPVLSELAHPVPGARSYSDVDVLVGPADLRAAVTALTSRGWLLLDRSQRLVLERMPGELHLLGPHGVPVDLHWSLVNDARTRPAFGLQTEELLARSVRRRVGGAQVPALDDVDALLHLCLHTALSGADRLLWLLDLDSWVRRTEPDWDVVVRRAHATGVCVAAALCLTRSRAALGTPLPDGLPAALVPQAWWRRSAALADRAQPVAGLVSDRSFARLCARASRGSARDSVAELVRRVPRALTAGGRDAPVPSVGQDRPDGAAWQAYLSAVAEQRG